MWLGSVLQVENYDNDLKQHDFSDTYCSLWLSSTKAIGRTWAHMISMHRWCIVGLLKWASQRSWKVEYSVSGSCIQAAARCFVLIGKLLSLVSNQCHVPYSTSLPMCYCVHVKDCLPQLGYKTHQLISEKTGTVCLLCLCQAAWFIRGPNFPTPSTSFRGIHVELRTRSRQVPVMLSHPSVCPV